MKKKDRGGLPRGGLGFWLLMAGSTLVTGWLAMFWYMSPLALGFSNWPDDPGMRAFVLDIYELSWRGGIPAVLLAQGLALVLAWRGRRVAAELVAVLANLGFAVLIGTVMALVG